MTNPRLILIVGCCGLASNIIGLFLFHDHGHSHDEHEGRAGTNTLSVAEAGKTNGVLRAPIEASRENETEALEDATASSTRGQDAKADAAASEVRSSPSAFKKRDETSSTTAGTTSPVSFWKSSSSSSRRAHQRHNSSTSKARLSSFEEIPVHPASFRNEIIQAGRLEPVDSGTTTEAENEAVGPDSGGSSPTEGSHLLRDPQRPYSTPNALPGRHPTDTPPHRRPPSINHQDHKHTHATNPSTPGGGHGHSHGDLNMRGVFLHVLGDALGNMGVIASALFIWLTGYWWRFYADPLISLLITLIILKTAIPLCRASARILLQAVPAGLSVDDIRADVEKLPGVEACHHLHVWQLSGQKLVASLHVRLACNFPGCDEERGARQYMTLAKAVRDCLHAYGIHSSTIQPEFCLAAEHGHGTASAPDGGGGSVGPSDGAPAGRSSGTGPGLRVRTSAAGSRATSGMNSPQEACLLECDDGCASSKCCVTPGEREDAHGH